MVDFRKQLYQKYSFQFHDAKRQADERYFKSYFHWLDYKVAPFLSNLSPDAQILELGCGQGHFLAYLRYKGFKDIQGVDVSEELTAIAKSASLDVQLADVFEYLEVLNKTFDAVIAIDFLEHFSREELLKLIPMIRKALKPGGIVLFQTPNGEGLFPRHVMYGELTHMTFLSPRSIKQLLTVADFCNIRFSECGPAPKNIQGAIRLFLWKIIRGIANVVRLIEIGVTQEIWTENMICAAENPAEAS